MQIIKMNEGVPSGLIRIDLEDILLSAKSKHNFYVTISVKEKRGKKNIGFLKIFLKEASKN